MITVEKWEDYQVEGLQSQQQTNNKPTTNQHKQECKEIYLLLFNKYKEHFSFEQNLIEKQKIFREKCMNDENFKELTQEEQTELYTKLISII